MGMAYYPVFVSEIAKRQIKKKDIAACIGVCYKAFNNKLSGRVPFTWPEVSEIRDHFFPDMAHDVLFSRAEQDST